MTWLASITGALLAAGVLAAGGLPGAGDGRHAPPRASGLVVDAAIARHGRALLDPRLRATGADVRVARSAEEALTDVRYLVAAGDSDLVVAGPRSAAAAREAGVAARRVAGVSGALAALGR